MAAPAFALVHKAPVKAAEAFRTISEVAAELALPQHVLRFWESRFTQIKPVKRAGGRRYYRPEDVDLLRGIQALLYAEGITIRGVQKILKEKGLRHVVRIGRGEEAQPAPPPVVEKLVFIEKPKTTRPRSGHLRAVPSPMSLPFFDLPQENGAGEPDRGANEAAGFGIEERLGIEERARLLALLAELEGLKRRLHKARKSGDI